MCLRRYEITTVAKLALETVEDYNSKDGQSYRFAADDELDLKTMQT